MNNKQKSLHILKTHNVKGVSERADWKKTTTYIRAFLSNSVLTPFSRSGATHSQFCLVL